MIISGKTLDTLIAISKAVSVVAEGGDGFKSNLEEIAKQRGQLNSISNGIKQKHGELSHLTEENRKSAEKLAEETQKAEAFAKRKDTATQKAAEAKQEAEEAKAEADAAIANARQEMEELKKAMSEFNQYEQETRKDLENRLASIKESEAKIARIEKAMEG